MENNMTAGNGKQRKTAEETAEEKKKKAKIRKSRK